MISQIASLLNLDLAALQTVIVFSKKEKRASWDRSIFVIELIVCHSTCIAFGKALPCAEDSKVFAPVDDSCRTKAGATASACWLKDLAFRPCLQRECAALRISELRTEMLTESF